MTDHPRDELGYRELHVVVSGSVFVLVPEEDAVFCLNGDTTIGDGATSDIGTKIFDHAFAVLIRGHDHDVPFLSAEFVEKVDELLLGHVIRWNDLLCL